MVDVMRKRRGATCQLAMHCPPLRLAAALALALCLSGPAAAWELAGTKQLTAHTRDGQQIALGTVVFTPQADGRATFKLQLAQQAFTDHFLSMKEFKCLAGADEIACHVPYPYPQPGTVSLNDLAWLEHSLLFLFKQPRDFGAKLWNGLYYQFKPSAKGLEGRPQAVDLNRISAPPEQAGVPPYKPALRDPIAPDARWLVRLTIE